MTNASATRQPEPLSPEQVREKLARLLVLSSDSRKPENKALAQSQMMEALTIGVEVGSAVLCAILRMADAQEHMARILECEYGPVAGDVLFRGK